LGSEPRVAWNHETPPPTPRRAAPIAAALDHEAAQEALPRDSPLAEIEFWRNRSAALGPGARQRGWVGGADFRPRGKQVSL